MAEPVLAPVQPGRIDGWLRRFVVSSGVGASFCGSFVAVFRKELLHIFRDRGTLLVWLSSRRVRRVAL